jgi:hypothetical protein
MLKQARLLISLVALMSINVGHAAPTYSFRAVTGGSDISGSPSFVAAWAGNPILVGSFTPGTTIDAVPDNPNFGLYSPPGPAYSFTAGIFSWSNGFSDLEGGVSVSDNPFDGDQFFAGGRLVGSSVDGLTPATGGRGGWSFLLEDVTGTALSNDQLPAAINLAAWNLAVLNLPFGGILVGTGDVAFRITDIRVIDEPSSVALLLLARLACNCMRRRTPASSAERSRSAAALQAH